MYGNSNTDGGNSSFENNRTKTRINTQESYVFQNPLFGRHIFFQTEIQLDRCKSCFYPKYKRTNNLIQKESTTEMGCRQF